MQAAIDKSIDLYVSEPEAESDYAKDKFIYDKEKDVYICPARQELKPPARMHKDAKTHTYKTSACLSCPYQDKCTKAKDGIRKIIRHNEKDELREQASEKAATDLGKEVLRQRKSVPEPVWGNMKKRDGLIQLHYRGLDKAGKEFRLRGIMHNLRKLFKVFVNNPKARNEITLMGIHPSQAAV
jgi:adenine-specific DNA glycosylase